MDLYLILDLNIILSCPIKASSPLKLCNLVFILKKQLSTCPRAFEKMASYLCPAEGIDSHVCI